ncbi:MAG: MBL fold metallo-hydrolase, partial [Nitrososphaerota archaeon]
MELADRVHMVEVQLGRRILYLYLFVGDVTVLLDTGMSQTPNSELLAYLSVANVKPEDISIAINTHCDADHFGGNAGLKNLSPRTLLLAHELDSELIEDPEMTMKERYLQFEERHSIILPSHVKVELRSMMGLPTRLDVLLRGGEEIRHLEVNFFEEAISRGVAEPFLPSPLVPNTQLVDYYFLNFPYGVQFQNHALANFTVNTKYVGDWFNSWKMLADSRLREKITLWVFEDNGFWGFLVMLAEELGKNYKNPDDMRDVLRWTAENIHPNVLKYTSDEAELDELLGRDISWASAYWCALAEGYSITRPELKGSQVLPWRFTSPHVNLPGVYWIPK